MNAVGRYSHQETDTGRRALSRALGLLFPVLLFLVAFLPRVEGLVARALLWHRRAQAFTEALATQQWADTFQAPHPGVTTMWLISSARWLATWADPNFARSPQLDQLVREIVPLTLAVSLLIVMAYFLLARLFDKLVAALATLLLALDPNHIAISKTLHPDPLVSALMLVSALWLIWFVVDSKRYRLALSGVFAGLALLTKTPALFLIPYLLLCLLVWQTNELLVRRTRLPRQKRLLWQWTKAIVPLALLWAAVLALTYVIVWPAMWSTPVTAVSNSLVGTLFYQGEAHEKSVLFLNQLFDEDPGVLFYPVHMALKSTEVVLPLFVLGAVLAFVAPRVRRKKRIALLLILAFILFYTLQMTLGAKKSGRYILPAMQFMPVVAAFAAVYLARWLAGGRRFMLAALLTSLLLLQAAIALPRHPYYGTHFNRIFGTPQTILGKNVIAGQDQAEGMDQAADYLNGLPQAPLLVVGTKKSEAFHRYFDGRTTAADAADTDYLVFTRNEIVRRLLTEAEWSRWESVQAQTPKHVVSFADVPYVWVYKMTDDVDPELIPNPQAIRLGADIRLLGYEFGPQTVAPGDPFTLKLYWQATRPTTGDYNVFVHLREPSGALHTQQDNPPQNGMYPTYLWDSDEIVVDTYQLTLDPEAEAGQYELAIGLYELSTLARLPVTSDSGDELPDSQVRLPGPRVP